MKMKLMLLLVQDCVCVVAPYPFRIEPLEDFDPIGDLDVTGGGDLWYARPLLFFTCTVCPTGHMGDTTSHKDVSLGAACSKSTCGCGAMEGRFLVKSLWIKLWNSARRGCRNPGLVALRLSGAGVMQPGQRELPLRSE